MTLQKITDNRTELYSQNSDDESEILPSISTSRKRKRKVSETKRTVKREKKDIQLINVKEEPRADSSGGNRLSYATLIFQSNIYIIGSLKIRISMNRRIMYMKQICSERHTIDDDDMRYEGTMSLTPVRSESMKRTFEVTVIVNCMLALIF